MTQKPFFSIITCTYNSEKTLLRNIDSVQNQTLTNFEQIFIDGESKDSTLKQIKKYQNNFKDKIKLYSTPPKGISNAMNFGIIKSNGKYLIHLHSDDSFYDKNVLQKVYDFIKNNNEPDLIYGQINVINNKNQSRGIFPTKKIFQIHSRQILKYYNYIPHQSVFIKNNVYKTYGVFDENLRIMMDYDYWLRVIGIIKTKYIPAIISNYLVSNTTKSGNKNNSEIIAIEKEILRKKYLNTLEHPIAKYIDLLIKNYIKNKNILKSDPN